MFWRWYIGALWLKLLFAVWFAPVDEMEPESSGETVYFYSGCWEAERTTEGPDPKLAASRDPHAAARGRCQLTADLRVQENGALNILHSPRPDIFRSFSGLSGKHFPQQIHCE